MKIVGHGLKFKFLGRLGYEVNKCLECLGHHWVAPPMQEAVYFVLNIDCVNSSDYLEEGVLFLVDVYAYNGQGFRTAVTDLLELHLKHVLHTLFGDGMDSFLKQVGFEVEDEGDCTLCFDYLVSLLMLVGLNERVDEGQVEIVAKVNQSIQELVVPFFYVT